MMQIICLANSYKEGGRCVAGLNTDTKTWVPPVSDSITRAIPLSTVAALGLKLLDILEIPLDNTGPDEGCQPENRLLLRGPWKKVGELQPKDLVAYCEDDNVVLHNHLDRVPPDVFRGMSKSRWKSLQLILSESTTFFQNPWGKWCVAFLYGNHRSLSLKLTDPVALNTLKSGHQIGDKCLLTVSMGTPYKRQANDVEFCWKMVAGVIEL